MNSTQIMSSSFEKIQDYLPDFSNKTDDDDDHHHHGAKHVFNVMNENLQIILILIMVIIMLIMMMCFANHIRRTVWMSSKKMFTRNPCIHGGHQNQFNRFNQRRNQNLMSLRRSTLQSNIHHPLSSLSPSTSQAATLYCSPSSATVFNLLLPTFLDHEPSAISAFSESSSSSSSSSLNPRFLIPNRLIVDDLLSLTTINDDDESIANQLPSYSEVVDEQQQQQQQVKESNMENKIKKSTTKINDEEIPPPSYQELRFV
ncbi:uncharacterized protein LOC124489764 [Dermatophagoides farinae]|uniref:uncharacterized protein LOC124489764 n=1 Tax=Dermatophagoides farinae TaxID=6954 RepID=UPI003F61CE1F